MTMFNPSRKMDRRRFRVDHKQTDQRDGQNVTIWFVEYLAYDTNKARGKYLWKDGTIDYGCKGPKDEWGGGLLTWAGYYESEAAAEASIAAFLKSKEKK